MGLAVIGNVIEVIPGDDLQVCHDEQSHEFVSDQSPFRFRVETKLLHEGRMYGLAGPVVAGHERYAGLIGSILTRADDSDWDNDDWCIAGFKVAPGVAMPNSDYDPALWAGVPFHVHPDGTHAAGYPLITRYAEVRVVDCEA